MSEDSAYSTVVQASAPSKRAYDAVDTSKVAGRGLSSSDTIIRKTMLKLQVSHSRVKMNKKIGEVGGFFFFGLVFFFGFCFGGFF